MILGRDDFAGVWQVARVITDRLGPGGAFHGTVTMLPEVDDRLRYHEIGQLKLDSGPMMMAERRYLWRFTARKIAVTFSDGTAFHVFQPHGQAAGTEHVCGPDLYRVAYDFRHWPRWQATWTVTGPRKEFTSVSDYAPGGTFADRLARRAGVGQ